MTVTFGAPKCFAERTKHKASENCKPSIGGGGGGGNGALEPDDDDDQGDEYLFEVPSFSAKLKWRNGLCQYCLDVYSAALCLAPELRIVVDTWQTQRLLK